MRILVHWVRILFLAVACWFGLSVAAAAQGALGAIAGTVLDESGAVLPGATVTLSNPGVIGGNQTTVSDGQGAFQFTRLVPGTYSVRAELQGFRTVIQENITVNAERTSRADLKLVVGSLTETITVAGEAPLLDTTSALKQTVLTRQILDTIPTGYDTWSIARLAPSIHLDKYDVGGREMFGQSGASAHGSTEREYFIDGMDLNQYGGTFYIDSFAFAEVNMATANVSAERSTGGVVWSFVTKTGTNQFHGTGAFLGMTHAMEANNISPALRTQLLAGVPAYALAANPNPRLGASVEHMFDLSSTFSGPIVKNRIWFSGAVKLGEVDQRRVGSYNADGTQLLSDNQLRQTTAKASFALTRNSQLHYVQSWVHKGRYHVAGGPNVTEFFAIEATSYNPARHWFHVLRWTDVLSSRAVLDVAGSLAYGNNNILPQPGLEPGALARFDAVTRVNTGARRTYTWNPGYRANIHTSLGYVAGSHDLKVGWQFIRSDVERGTYLTSHYPSGLNAIYRNGVPDSVNTYNAPVYGTSKLRTDGIYIQDKWSPVRRLVLNLGFRYEDAFGWLNDGQTPLCSQANIFGAVAACFPAVKNTPNFKGVIPRLSMVYDVFGDGRTALKFAANRYNERITDGFANRVNPIGSASDTRSWTDLNNDLIPQLNELGPSSGFNVGTTNRYAEDLKWPKTNEVSVEFEQELPGRVVVGTGYFYRAYRDQVGNRNLLVTPESYRKITVTEAITGRQVTLYDQDPATRGRFDVVYYNTPEMDRTYHGVDLTVQKRMANRWMLMGSINYGKNDGSMGGDLNNPNNAEFRRGIATADDVPFFFKLSGAYQLPYGVSASGSFQYYMGWPETTVVRVSSNTVRLTQTNQNVIIEPRGTVRMDDVTLADLSFRKTFTFGGLSVEPRVDIYNLLNGSTVTDRIQQLGPSYHNVIEFLGSRMIKLGANVSW